MTEQKPQPWDAVFDQINVYRDSDWVPIPRPTDDELDRVETQLGSPLPLSYRAFLKRFGPGELESSLRLTPVTVTSRANFTLVEETVEQRAFFAKHKKQNTEWLGRVVYFGCNAGGDWYCWDPNELAASGNGECAVYWLPRHEEEDPQLQADSFFEFVRVVLERIRELREEEPPEEDDPGNTFRPYSLRRKEQPSPIDVQLWLAWNNNTARDLALSIRDRGQTDAFRILADALQEAGCENADLLDSCRTGDPDIDGKWVLQVLLGKV